MTQLEMATEPMSGAGSVRPYSPRGWRSVQRCGVSRWHPDPARECDRVEAEQHQAAR
jgi:hypothetical protein